MTIKILNAGKPPMPPPVGCPWLIDYPCEKR